MRRQDDAEDPQAGEEGEVEVEVGRAIEIGDAEDKAVEADEVGLDRVPAETVRAIVKLPLGTRTGEEEEEALEEEDEAEGKEEEEGFDRLPDEMVLAVVTFLPLGTRLLCRSVSRRLRALAPP